LTSLLRFLCVLVLTCALALLFHADDNTAAPQTVTVTTPFYKEKKDDVKLLAGTMTQAKTSVEEGALT
jgi:hypothetical protein